MPWGAAIGAVGSIASAAMTDSGGGAGSSTASKEPWKDAAPWLRDNIKAGQDLQAQYQATPFNAQQLAAYGNMGRQTNYMNNLVPDLLGQIGNQRGGFDRSNTNGRVTPYTFNGSGMGGGAQSGLLGQLANPDAVSQYTSAANPAPVAAPVAAQSPSTFVGWDQAAALDAMRNGEGMRPTVGAGLGAFQYGDQAPAPGTQAYLDMQQYMQGMGGLNSGGDPYGYYNGSAGAPRE